jgi:hypothetical protein
MMSRPLADVTVRGDRDEEHDKSKLSTLAATGAMLACLAETAAPARPGLQSLGHANASYFESLAAFAFESIEVAFATLRLDPEQAHFELTLRTGDQGFWTLRYPYH